MLMLEGLISSRPLHDNHFREVTGYVSIRLLIFKHKHNDRDN